MRKAGVATFVIAALLTLGAGAAGAVSDGQYDPARQHCSSSAESTANDDTAEDGCTNFIIGVRSGSGSDAAFVGFRQTPEGEPVDPTNPIYGVDPAALDPAGPAGVYFGADDNLNTGEHDGSPAINNGPSDGGAIVANVDPSTLDAWLAALQAGDVDYVLRHPLPLVDAGMGACADGVCVAVTTVERVAYEGAGKGSQPVADYSGKEWDPETCAGPSDGKADCGPGGIAKWHRSDGTRTTEPGVQVYEDPDPQGSPIGPYPLPALYAGTCGAVVGGGPSATAPESPITNSAGQLQVDTGCG